MTFQLIGAGTLQLRYFKNPRLLHKSKKIESTLKNSRRNYTRTPESVGCSAAYGHGDRQGRLFLRLKKNSTFVCKRKLLFKFSTNIIKKKNYFFLLLLGSSKVPYKFSRGLNPTFDDQIDPKWIVLKGNN